MTTSREKILDGALEVMRARGLARATTKEIARAAGVSEALLYKLFTDKTDLFLCVFAERLSWRSALRDYVTDRVGKRTVAENLTAMLIEIEQLFDANLPIAMSLFSDVELMAREVEALKTRGGPGPGVLIQNVGDYLRAEQAAGRVRTGVAIDAAATTLVATSLHRAFAAYFYVGGRGEDHKKAFGDLAEGVVAVVLGGIAID
jgi:AcrR family transcriptional regulator